MSAAQEDTTGSGLGGVSGGGVAGGASGSGATAGAGGASGAAGGSTTAGAAGGLGGQAGVAPNGGVSLLGRLAAATLPEHPHLSPATGGVIDYLRTQWGTDHLAAPDPHAQYATDADLAGYLTPAAANALFLTPAEGDALFLTAAEGDARYLPASYTPPATDVTITSDASLVATEAPANTFALNVRVSPDAGNSLALHANGLYGTDTTGGGGTVDVTITGDNGIGVIESPANTFALATRVSPTAGNSLALQAGGLFVPDFLTQTEGDARYTQGGLTQAAADARYEPLDSAYTKTESDARYEPLDSAYTKGEADARYVPLTLPDAKGDLLAASGADALGRLPLGADGQVLTADSAQALGVKWAAAGGGGAFVDEAGDTMTGLLTLQGAAAATNVLQAKLAADAQPRFRANAGGKLEWGPGGSTTPDVSLTPGTAGTTSLQLVGHFYPVTTNVHNLGASGRDWQNVFARAFVGADGSAYLSLGPSPLPGLGAVRLPNAASLMWRNAANSNNLALTWGAADRFGLQFAGTERFAVDSTGLVAASGLVATGASATANVLQTKLAADTQPRFRADASGLHEWGPGGSTAPDATLTRTAAGALRLNESLLVQGPTAGLLFQARGGAEQWQWYADGAGAYLYQVTPARQRLAAGITGTLTVMPDPGAKALVANGRTDVNGDAYTWSHHPLVDNTYQLGYSAFKWASVYAVNGTIQTSAAEAKTDITPLAPAAALAAVLATDPVTFTYTAPAPTAAQYELPDDPEEAEQVLHQRLVNAPLQAAARSQAGFVLASPDYATSPLLETGTGQSNAANTAGVLLAALHEIDRRLTAGGL